MGPICTQEVDLVNRGAVEAFWGEYVAATGTVAGYEAWGFGDGGHPDLRDQLAMLVRDGPKRATTGLLAEYEQEGEPLPDVGSHHVILDSRGDPVCIIVTTSVETRRLGDVDDEFAWTEGEGDRSLGYWRRAHVDYWASIGIETDGDTLVVLEWFDKVWPR